MATLRIDDLPLSFKSKREYQTWVRSWMHELQVVEFMIKNVKYIARNPFSAPEERRLAQAAHARVRRIANELGMLRIISKVRAAHQMGKAHPRHNEFAELAGLMSIGEQQESLS